MRGGMGEGRKGWPSPRSLSWEPLGNVVFLRNKTRKGEIGEYLANLTDSSNHLYLALNLPSNPNKICFYKCDTWIRTYIMSSTLP